MRNLEGLVLLGEHIESTLALLELVLRFFARPLELGGMYLQFLDFLVFVPKLLVKFLDLFVQEQELLGCLPVFLIAFSDLGGFACFYPFLL
jgi:hypothetical protein